ncbi:MAG: putative selenium-dependent hydroxylase accessory protein YqeC [Proteobacteria bacterium]|nr:putative selenium-dependent hydroxylase accessory protein YqeC [Pseudomonadota bacterium]
MPVRAATPMDALGLERPPCLVSIVGGGGKSSLMFALARGLPGRVVATTTTRIFAAQTREAEQASGLDDPDWRARLETFDSSLLVYGEVRGEHALGIPPALAGEILDHPRVDWVVNEADGSRMLPAKAPAEHEPVVPERTRLLVAVAGIDALSGPIRDVTHRPERVSALTSSDPEDNLTPETLALLLSSPRGGLKGIPAAARAAVLINKVHAPAQVESAREVARHILAREPRVERVALGALQADPPSAWEVWQR